MKRKCADFPNQLETKVDLPKDAVWQLLGRVISDLDVCSADFRLHKAIRGRNVVDVLACLSRYDARSIIDRLGSSPADVSTFGKLYQVGALIKKFPFKGLDTFTPAYKKFLACEEKCRLYNTQNYRALKKLSSSHPFYYGLLDDLRKEIHLLIGDAPSIEEVYANGKHGPGQTAGGQFKGGRVTDFFKFSELPYSVTSRARPYAIDCIATDPRWMGALCDWYRNQNCIPQWKPIDMDAFWESVLVTCDASEITSVPKTALTDRFIAMEATFNVFLQLGVDGVIRRRLREGWKYDLNDQTLNQKLAEVGSLTNDLATLDLSGASDTVSLMICYLLLPPMWMDLLLDLRMDKGVVKKTKDKITFHKMSSMGNGFTFAIESLIFGACTRVAMRRSSNMGKSAVYGDDIICPSKAAPLLVDILVLCGFEINSEKSFFSGPFRESCGKDYFLGHDVRPFFITDEFADVPSLFHICNSLRLQQRKWEWPYGHTFERSIERVLTWIPPDFRAKFRGPFSETTDSHLFVEEPLLTDRRGYRYHFRLVERPAPFRLHHRKMYDTFFFRKLMVQIKPSNGLDWMHNPGRPIDKWDWRKKFSRGNAFDIWTRDHTFFKAVRSYVP